MIVSRHIALASVVVVVICLARCSTRTSVDSKNLGREEFAVSKAALRRSLALAAPNWTTPKLHSLTHALRLANVGHDLSAFPPVGPQRHFTKSQIVNILLENDLSAFPGWQSVLCPSEHGVRVQEMARLTGSFGGGRAHRDDILAACAVAGLPVGTPIMNGRFCLADLLSHSISTFTLDGELEWTAVSYATYLPPRCSWNNRWDETFRLDDIAFRLLYTAGESNNACYGLHRPYAICRILRSNEEHQDMLLNGRTKLHCIRFLRQLADRLQREQDESGLYLTSLSGQVSYRDDLFAAIVTAGHHLEWISIAPHDARPSATSINRCVESMDDLVQHVPFHEREFFYGPLSHYASSLAAFEKNRIGMYDL